MIRKISSIILSVAMAVVAADGATTVSAPASGKPGDKAVQAPVDAKAEDKAAEVEAQFQAKLQAAQLEVEKKLAFIPDVAATYGKNGTVTGLELRLPLQEQVLMAIFQGQEIPDADLHKAVQEFAKEAAVAGLILEEAVSKGFALDLAAAKEMLKKELEGNPGVMAEMQKKGLTEDFLVRKYAEGTALQKYITSLAAPVTDADVQKFYDEHKDAFTQYSASHILAAFDPKNAGAAPTEEQKKAALERITAIQKELQAGKDFAALAKEKSDCPSKEKGGDLGSFQPGQMVPAFEEAFKKLKAGEVSGIVETQFGYHIIKAGATVVKSLDEVKVNLKDYLQRANVRKAFQEKQQVYLQDASIKVLVP